MKLKKYMSGNKKIFISMFIMISFTALCQNYRVMYDYSFVSDSTNINNILRYDVDLVFKKLAGIHVSGHGSKEEQKLMLNYQIQL